MAVTQRGCDDAKIRNMLFNGVDAYRDLHTIAGIVRESCEGSLIVASGISFGGCTVANYAGVYGKDSRLDGVVSVAGCPDLSVTVRYRYSHRAYTPGVAHCKKIASCYDRRKLAILHRCGVDVEHVVSQECWDMVDYDHHVTCKLINKKDVFDAANEVSLAPSDKSDPRSKKPQNVTIPTLCVQAQNDTFMDVNSADVSVPEQFDNIMYIVTKEGTLQVLFVKNIFNKRFWCNINIIFTTYFQVRSIVFQKFYFNKFSSILNFRMLQVGIVDGRAVGILRITGMRA